MTTRIILSGILFLLIISGCKHNHEHSEEASEAHLGVLEHDFNIGEKAKADFDQGLLLIHSFEYDDALTAFQAAKEKDSTEVMAYWGEAMSHYKALWGLQDKRAGYAVLEQLGLTKEDRLGKIEDDIEQDFWEGVEILYGDGTLKERNESFNNHMGMLHEKYPKNQEAAAFFALSMMWDNDRDENSHDVSRRSAKVASNILKENPLHPGALHYTIHAFDDPALADMAMEAANKYSKVAPDAGHALHMPSHIYLALGMWPEVVASNEVSYQASVNRMERLELDDEARGYHAYAWLHYAYLQQGRENDAIRLLKDIAKYYENTQYKSIRSYITAMQGAQLFETGKWPEELDLLEVNTSDLGLHAARNVALYKADIAMRKGDVTQITEIEKSFNKEIDKAELFLSDEATKMCSAGPSRYAPNEDAIMKAKAVLNEIWAMKSMLSGEGMTEDFLKKAVDLERESEYSFGPVDIAYPSFEMYADWLSEQGRHEDAISQYDMSLERAPNRRKALLGKKKALIALGKQNEANEIDEILEGFFDKGALSAL